MWIILELIETAISGDLTIIHHDYSVAQMQEIDRMGHQDPSLVFQQALEDMRKNLLLDVCVERRYGIIHDDDI